MTEKNISGLPPMKSFEEAFKNAFNDSLKRNTKNISSVQHDQKCTQKNGISDNIHDFDKFVEVN